jgi:hypothetical protein
VTQCAAGSSEASSHPTTHGSAAAPSTRSIRLHLAPLTSRLGDGDNQPVAKVPIPRPRCPGEVAQLTPSADNHASTSRGSSAVRI